MPSETIDAAREWYAANVNTGRGSDVGRESVNEMRVRLMRAQEEGERLKNRLRKFEVDAAEKELVPAATAQEVIDVALGPLISSLQNMEDQLKVKCNPVDPELAGAALREWRDRVMLQCSTALQKAAGQRRTKSTTQPTATAA